MYRKVELYIVPGALLPQLHKQNPPERVINYLVYLVHVREIPGGALQSVVMLIKRRILLKYPIKINPAS